MVLQMNSKDKSREEYIARINRVTDYIEKHLNEEISLDIIAQVACFSPFHFHRIFTTLTNETINTFIQRKRIEKAVQKLRNEKHVSISEIAFNCGFGSVAHFSRTFRKYWGMTAKEFRETDKAVFAQDGLYFSKNGQMVRKINQLSSDFKGQLCSDTFNQFNHSNFIIMDTKIEIKEMPEFNVVYCRHTGQFNQIGKAYEKLMKWAGPRGLLNFPATKTITVYHDDPAITAIEQVRQSACITLDNDVKVDGEFCKMRLESGKYAVGHFKIDEQGFEKAWNTMCLWFTESGYQPGDGYPYELYYNSPEEDKKRMFVLDIGIPVKTL
ncbi:MAG TPA: AraC family transcriptional regulator [Bacteroidales bacterium]|nr:AraC family transcriptional regulator [Bacteroidales bacterium]HPI31374.1 AraC family transcriptional regulator [Bacteroidales bacterium]HQN16849.1 AraC family transcriptional regulator [Bacteroidales bacterium]HQP16483.1 AraC family transcriptional regulator [Bacteroidales bacterium]